MIVNKVKIKEPKKLCQRKFAKLSKLVSPSHSDEADDNEIPDELEHDDGRLQTPRRRDWAKPHGDGEAAERRDQEVDSGGHRRGGEYGGEAGAAEEGKRGQGEGSRGEEEGDPRPEEVLPGQRARARAAAATRCVRG